MGTRAEFAPLPPPPPPPFRKHLYSNRFAFQRAARIGTATACRRGVGRANSRCLALPAPGHAWLAP
eukprot:7017714-Pyramimonas_sp.AAC.1